VRSRARKAACDGWHGSSPTPGAPRPAALVSATPAGLLARGSTPPALPSRALELSGPLPRGSGRASGSPLTVAGAAADLPPDRDPARAHGVPFSPARAGPTTGRVCPDRSPATRAAAAGLHILALW